MDLQEPIVIVYHCSVGVASPRTRPSQVGGAALYPNLLEDYSVISMPSAGDYSDVQKLLLNADHLSTTLRSNISSLESIVHKSQKGIVIVN